MERLSLGKQRIVIECPNCGFPTRVLLRQVVHREVLVCGGCKNNIQLVDQLASIRRAERQLQKSVDQLAGSLGNTTFTIRI